MRASLSAAPELGSGDRDHYLSFCLGEALLASDVARVRRVIPWPGPDGGRTSCPEWLIGGVPWRRGQAPVVDLGRKLGLPTQPRPGPGCLVMVRAGLAIEVSVAETDVADVALLVDRVDRVLFVPRPRIHPPPRLSAVDVADVTDVTPPAISGVFAEGEGFVLVLDLGRLFTADEMLRLREWSQQPASAS